MSQTTLLSLTNEEAVVAENVTTYKRAEIEKQYATLSEMVRKDNEALPALRQQVKEIEDRLQANAYTLDLYRALLEQFNAKYPAAAEKPADSATPAEEPKESVVEEKVDSTAESEIPKEENK